jgi:single-strand DNA-binding protein
VSQFGKEREEEPLYINITAWEKLADACAERLRKGNKIVVHGSLKPESWEAKDGTKRSAISIRAVSIEFMQMKGIVADDGYGPLEGDTPRAVQESEPEPTGLPF